MTIADVILGLGKAAAAGITAGLDAWQQHKDETEAVRRDEAAKSAAALAEMQRRANGNPS